MMLRHRKFIVFAVVLTLILSFVQPAVMQADTSSIHTTFIIDTSKERAAISPLIYGTNQDGSADAGFTARRLGGNRMTGYNWENNASNAGSDWQHSSDTYLCSVTGVSTDQCNVTGTVLTSFHNKSLEKGAYSLITLPMAGYVAKDKSGIVRAGETAPSQRWNQVVPAKGSAFALQPDLNDNFVYVDEEVNYLVNRYGKASTASGVKGYAMDNEPGLWSETHPRIHPQATGAAELADKSIQLARAVKNVDASAELYGPSLYGFSAFYNLQNAADWNGLKGSYGWYIDYYLDRMKRASDAEGKRLLDVLDLHWYPEAQGGGVRIVNNGAGSVEMQKARVQAPRSLWDPQYKETSWIAANFAAYLPLLPKVKASIDKYYPGTKLGISEFSYGGENHISGGIAAADALGIFGKQGVHFASFWKTENNADYVASAYKLFRNADGKGLTFGNTKVKADTSDHANSSIYASVANESNDQLHLIVINKNFDKPMNAAIHIASNKNYTGGKVYGFDKSSSTLKEFSQIQNVSGNQFQYSVPPLTAIHIVLKEGTPAPIPVIGNGTGLKGEYYNNTNFTDLKVTRLDGTVNFDWGKGSPDASVGADTFSVRWTGQVQPKYSELYTFHTVSDDGIRLWVNGQKLIDQWSDHSAKEHSGSIWLAAGQKYDIKLEYYENGGYTAAKLLWSSQSQVKQIIPQQQLYPASFIQNGNGNGLNGQYFNNKDFTKLKLTRLDHEVNFNWGTGRPHHEIDADTFSIRWTGQIQPLYTEAYTFYTSSDDGVRLWVNGQKLIDNWTDHPATENAGSIVLQAGQKYDIKLEYYENMGNSVAKLMWSSPSQLKQVVPKSQLYAYDRVPKAPTGLKAKGEYKKIELTWNASDTATSYEVKRSTKVNGPYVRVATVHEPKFTDTRVGSEKRYYYVVSAVNAKGASGNSSSASAITQKK